MKTFMIFMVLIGVLFGTCVSANPIPKGIQILKAGVAAPKTQFVDPDGKLLGLDTFKGKLVVLNVWATWCGPCIKEMPSLDRLANEIDPNKVVLLAVTQDKGGTAVAKPFLNRLGILNLRTYADPAGRLSRSLGIRGLPTTFLISPSGIIVGRVEGALEWDADDIILYITTLAR